MDQEKEAESFDRIAVVTLSAQGWAVLDEQMALRELDRNAFVSLLLQAYTTPPPIASEVAEEPPSPSQEEPVPEFGQAEHLVLIGRNYRQLQEMSLQLGQELVRYGINPGSPHFDRFLDRLVGEDGIQFASMVPGVRSPGGESASVEEEAPEIPETPEFQDVPPPETDASLGSTASPINEELDQEVVAMLAELDQEKPDQEEPEKPDPDPFLRSPTELDPRLTKAKFEEFIPRLPIPIPTALLTYYKQGKDVEGVAQQMSESLEVVQDYISSGQKKLLIMLDMPVIPDTQLRSIFYHRHCKPIEINILQALWNRVDVLGAAESLRTSPGKIRHRFTDILPKMVSTGSDPVETAVFSALRRIIELRKEGDKA